MRAFCIVIGHPPVEVGLQFIQGGIDLLAEGNIIEFFLDGSVEAFTDAVSLRMVCFGFAVIDIFNRQVELILMGFERAIVFRASVGQDPQ